MFLRTVILSLLGIALTSAYSKDAEQPMKMRKMDIPVKVPYHDGHHALLQKIPSKRPIESLVVAKNSALKSTGPTGYILYYEYNNDHCEEPLFYTFAIGTGTCFVALDESGDSLFSVSYEVGSDIEDTHTVECTLYEDYTCATAISNFSYELDMSCVSSGATYSSRGSFTDNMEPWSKIDGLIFQFYGTESQCVTNEPYGFWSAVSKDVCMSDGVQGSSKLVECADDEYKWAGYVDLDCQQLAAEVATPLTTCEYLEPGEDDDADSSYIYYSSQSCSSLFIESKTLSTPYTGGANPYRKPLGSTCTGPHEFCCEAPNKDPNNCPSSARTDDCDKQGACCCA